MPKALHAYVNWKCLYDEDLNSVGHSPTIWHRDNGTENGNYIVHWGCISYIGVMEKKMETITLQGCIYCTTGVIVVNKGIDYTGSTRFVFLHYIGVLDLL